MRYPYQISLIYISIRPLAACRFWQNFCFSAACCCWTIQHVVSAAKSGRHRTLHYPAAVLKQKFEGWHHYKSLSLLLSVLSSFSMTLIVLYQKQLSYTSWAHLNDRHRAYVDHNYRPLSQLQLFSLTQQQQCQ